MHRAIAAGSRAAAIGLAFPLALACAACSTPPPPPQDPGARTTNVDQPRKIVTDPALFAPDVSTDKDSFVVTDSLAITDTEENACTELREKALKRAVELTVKDLIRDESKFRQNENEIRRVLIGQFQKFVESHEVVQRTTFGDGRKLGLKVRVKTSRDKAGKELQDMGLFREDQGSMRVVLVMRKLAGEGQERDFQQSTIDDLGEGLSRELIERGFKTRLWKDVSLRIAENRAGLDGAQEKFIRTYVEESDWRNPKDERYELPLIVLRGEGRLLVGFRILELEKKELAYHALLRADAYDLLNAQSLGYDTESGRVVIRDDMTPAEARQKVVSQTASKLMAKHSGKLQELLDKERRRAKKAYTLTFEGYDEKQLERLETLLTGIVAEDLDSSNDGKVLVVRARVDREPIPLRDEISRTLKALGLGARPARRDGTAMTFSKE